uniref:DUF3426 domain-containing protein n=1 Tax=Marinobacterium profundum TaxID=1714300 RepID=UPI0008354BC2|nr:DUF3426 domain-containing protein [Marinobacterium profundum]
MNGGIITECPECETRFNVSEGQLKLADGKVRCGACLRVFDARAHQPYSGIQLPQPEIGNGSNAEEQPAQQEYSLHVRYAQAPKASTEAQTQIPAEPAKPVNDLAAFDPDAPLEVSSPAEAPKDQPQHNGPRTAPQKPSTPIPIASFLRTPAQDAPSEERPLDSFEQTHAQTPERRASEKSDARSEHSSQTVPEPTSEPEPEAIAVAATAHDQTGPAKSVTLSKHEPEPVIEATARIEANSTPAHTQSRPSTAAPKQIEPAPQAAPQPTPQPQGLAALQDLHAEPLELMHPITPAAPGAVLGWSLGCLAACVLLASQLAWFNRIEWSREPLLADAYEILCHQLECAIPPYQAVELIHNRQLVVRAHPRIEDALSIDLLLENTADFRQPFPAIELSFADIRGRTVARRLLQPQEYLDDILDPLKMPNSQPFQVNLAILDPGRRAVSYEVQLAPARL